MLQIQGVRLALNHISFSTTEEISQVSGLLLECG